ncbi:MAG: TraR/DksA C4-type zinc finger protein [Thermodesulfobacteriota bacterium]|nr:TraR/DksA C4-type zinc finger protein [Thermodesulfobacteriota bacterium]
MPVKKNTKKKSDIKSAKKVIPIKKASKTIKESSSSKKLSVKFRREMQKILNDMRKSLLEDINNTMKTESNHLKFDVGDFYDNASSDRERELSLSLSQRDRQKLNQIEDALKRLEAKTYGQCLMCKDLISEDRLKVMPFTVYCVACLEEEEASNSS